MNQPQNLENVLADRGQQYGDFGPQAMLSQALKGMVYQHAQFMGVQLNPVQREGIEMIMHKIARIANGNPDNPDSWLDISGYARIVHDRLPCFMMRPEDAQPQAGAPAQGENGPGEPVPPVTPTDVAAPAPEANGDTAAPAGEAIPVPPDHTPFVDTLGIVR